MSQAPSQFSCRWFGLYIVSQRLPDRSFACIVLYFQITNHTILPRPTSSVFGLFCFSASFSISLLNTPLDAIPAPSPLRIDPTEDPVLLSAGPCTPDATLSTTPLPAFHTPAATFPQSVVSNPVTALSTTAFHLVRRRSERGWEVR